MTSIELPVWQFLTGLAALIVFFGTMLMVTVRVIVNQFTRRLEERHTDMKSALDTSVGGLKSTLTSMEKRNDERFDKMSEDTRRIERDLLQLKADLPNQYERRDDAVRREVGIITQLEAIRRDIREKRV